MATRKFLVDIEVDGAIDATGGIQVGGNSIVEGNLRVDGAFDVYSTGGDQFMKMEQGSATVTIGDMDAISWGTNIKIKGNTGDFIVQDDSGENMKLTNSGALTVAGDVEANGVALTGAPSIYSVASESAMTALTTTKGDVVVRTDESKSYMDNGGGLYGSELLSNGDFSSIAYPWNYGAWSYIPNPTVSGGVATLEVEGGSFPLIVPRIEQQITVTGGSDYYIEVTGDGNGNDIQIIAVDPNNFYAFIDSFDITSNGTFTTNSMTITAPSGGLVIQIIVKGVAGDEAYISNASIRESSLIAKYTHFASL